MVRAGPRRARRAVQARSPRELSDEALLARVARSDPEATVVFVGRFQHRVFGLASTILGASVVAEDVAGEALLRARRHAGAFDSRRGSVLTWLLTITRNLAIEAIRAGRAVAVVPDDLLGLSPATSGRQPPEAVVARDDAERLLDAVTRLPDEECRALVLAGVWGLSARDVADRQEIPLDTAGTRIRAGLERLRVALGDEEQTE